MEERIFDMPRADSQKDRWSHLEGKAQDREEQVKGPNPG